MGIKGEILILVNYIIIAKTNNNSNEKSEKLKECIKISKRFKTNQAKIIKKSATVQNIVLFKKKM